MIEGSMNSKSFELNVVILFTLLFVLTLIILMPCMGGLSGCTIIYLSIIRLEASC